MTFDVIGQPERWRNPYTGREAGTVAYLHIVEG
jgi:hypothetical protein